ncbi:pyridoxine 5'-phosphate synthase [Candidatus Puniceispirillum sp.]|jgi:pyridoxine 5-phosphate synthase|uniref:pyridoxine 5'-phosphate synthase n=1 Tax=Candidatus Puniceispirillum sp. TaxID=2026719 RepID=UPI001ED664C5|nr:pyridoxine 5'-phosphate synthase [Candidatus Puniceispirillum sp.]
MAETSPVSSLSRLRLGVNIDHVATLRNARGGIHPNPVDAALLAQKAGADGITAHLREDRRHIRDDDIRAIKDAILVPLNFEMAANSEMIDMALTVRPNAACIVPERREEVTTEGGLAVAGNEDRLGTLLKPLKDAGIRLSLFIEANEAEIDAARAIGADIVELHTGRYCHDEANRAMECARIRSAATYAVNQGIECHAGHGLTFDTVAAIAAIPEMEELNIGHFLIGESIFLGLPEAIRHMRSLMDDARTGLSV